MKNESVIILQKNLLLVVAIGLLPIALSYGLIPKRSLSFLYEITVTETNLENILRAVMGLYLALIAFWFIGVFKSKLREAAIFSLIAFMYGLAGGRIISLIFDGFPDWIFMVYLFLELLFGTLGILLIKKSTRL